MKPSNTRIGLALAGLLTVGVMPQAFAAGPASGTLSGTTVSNTASVAYSVGGTAQTAVSSNASTFKVDRLVNVTVAQSGGATSVAPGSTAQVITFTVTNNTNSAQDFALTAANLTGDNFDGTITGVYVESSASPNGYQAGTDTATYIDELAPDATVTVYVVANMPSGIVTGNLANVSLQATAYQNTDGTGAYVATAGSLASSGAAVQTNTGSADNTAYTDTVFGDLAGTASGDAAKDGKHSATSTYSVSTAALTVSKSSSVISDPFNGTTNPKAIPGAVVEYCLVVSNASGGAAASSVVLTDVMPTQTTYSAASMKSGTGATCNSGTVTSLTDSSADGDGASYTSGTTTVSIGTASIAAGSSVWAVFRVTVK
ncbi:MAG: hypothetical protein REI12_05825 [Pedobacter sp.]|nr:hypothetical protein [Pedobacter sp.]